MPKSRQDGHISMTMDDSKVLLISYVLHQGRNDRCDGAQLLSSMVSMEGAEGREEGGDQENEGNKSPKLATACSECGVGFFDS